MAEGVATNVPSISQNQPDFPCKIPISRLQAFTDAYHTNHNCFSATWCSPSVCCIQLFSLAISFDCKLFRAGAIFSLCVRSTYHSGVPIQRRNIHFIKRSDTRGLLAKSSCSFCPIMPQSLWNPPPFVGGHNL